MNMVTPAMQLASKVPDLTVQVWSAAILKELYGLQGDPVKIKESQELLDKYQHMLQQDDFNATQQPEHKLIFWTEGEFPLVRR